MKLKRKPEERCYRCGDRVEWNDDTIWQLTRIDPHTRIQRPITSDEQEDARRRREREPRLHLSTLGFYLACVCDECADAGKE